MGGQLDIRPPQSKNWGGRVPPIPPRIDAPGDSFNNLLFDTALSELGTPIYDAFIPSMSSYSSC